MRNNQQSGKDGSGETNTGGYYFWDLNAKINHKFSETCRLYLSGYFGRDRFYNDGTNEYTTDIDTSTTVQNSSNGLRWGNTIAAIRWNKIITPKLFMNVRGHTANINSVLGVRTNLRRHILMRQVQAKTSSSIMIQEFRIGVEK